jgi:hypothetical protein
VTRHGFRFPPRQTGHRFASTSQPISPRGSVPQDTTPYDRARRPFAWAGMSQSTPPHATPPHRTAWHGMAWQAPAGHGRTRQGWSVLVSWCAFFSKSKDTMPGGRCTRTCRDGRQKPHVDSTGCLEARGVPGPNGAGRGYLFGSIFDEPSRFSDAEILSPSSPIQSLAPVDLDTILRAGHDPTLRLSRRVYLWLPPSGEVLVLPRLRLRIPSSLSEKRGRPDYCRQSLTEAPF